MFLQQAKQQTTSNEKTLFLVAFCVINSASKKLKEKDGSGNLLIINLNTRFHGSS